MFTRCPDCQKTQPLTVEQLRSGRGMLRCTRCSSMFDALLLISEIEVTGTAENEPVEPALWAKSREPKRLHWGFAFAVGLLMLVVQSVYFEGYALTQKPGFRLWAENFCSQFHCQLPVYRNIDEFEVLHRSLAELPDHNYAFKVVFSNQAAFRQPYPNINLTLLDFDGKAFAQRMLLPEDYISDASKTVMIEAEATAEISLNIAAPNTKVGGFDFDFTF